MPSLPRASRRRRRHSRARDMSEPRRALATRRRKSAAMGFLVLRPLRSDHPPREDRSLSSSAAATPAAPLWISRDSAPHADSMKSKIEAARSRPRARARRTCATPAGARSAGLWRARTSRPRRSRPPRRSAAFAPRSATRRGISPPAPSRARGESWPARCRIRRRCTLRRRDVARGVPLPQPTSTRRPAA